MEGIDISNGKMSQVILFKRSDLKKSIISKSTINQRNFINFFNFRKFTDGQLFAIMIYPLTKEEFLFKVIPGSCIGSEVTLSLSEGSNLKFEGFLFKGLLIDTGKSVIIMQGDPILSTSRELTIRLRKSGTIYNARQAKRYLCQNVNARIYSGSGEYSGTLWEFNPTGLRIDLLDFKSPESGPHVYTELIKVELRRDDKLIFSGISKLIRIENNGKTVVLAPMNIPQIRYSERKNRNPRLNLVPRPDVKFTHPLTGKRVSYDIININSSGFSVMVESDSTLLMPGMIIDEASIEFAGGLNIKCPVQVIYGEKKRNKFIQYGFMITDIDVKSYNHLFNVITRADDPYARVSYDVEMLSLWDFFFESGFIYPEKYTCIEQYKDDFKNTYEKLYHHCPDLFANLTYERNGLIYGHVSLIKAYERSWLVNHLAAKRMGLKITGLNVLRQILNYFDIFSRMPSIDMKYLIMYFRPDNNFPNYFFGGYCRAVDNPSHLSMDIFAYLTLEVSNSIPALPDNWALRQGTTQDIQDLRSSYKELSGGLMVDAFCLDVPKMPGESIEDLYEKHGLRRQCNIYTLFYDDKPQAYFVADHSDKGINLSDLINSIKVIVPHNSSVPWHVLHEAICECSRDYGTKTITIQVFPCEYLDKQGIQYKKKYVMWVLDTKYFHASIDIIKSMARFSLIKYLKRTISNFIRR